LLVVWVSHIGPPLKLALPHVLIGTQVGMVGSRRPPVIWVQPYL
jgi:hypothetical protein